MRKLILALLLITSSNAVNYWDETDGKPYFEQRDNKAHILVSAAIAGAITYEMKNRWEFEPMTAWLVGVGTAIAIGVAKESTDTRFDSQDVTGYVLGGVISSSIIVWTF